MSANKKLNNTKSPGFDFENHKGGKTTLESLKGKYVYIDVWATWCGPCRAEIPFLKEIEAKYHGKNIEFVSISADVQKDYDKWKNFVTEKQLGGIQLYADKNWESDFLKAFGISSIPRFILIDPNGIVVDADAARPSSPKLKEQLDKLLK
ncbi:MAG: TlpA disulfide reductase family protein [Flavobacterium sp.]|nr:TlpA disulfide reductase family protein [Flavobacterium sp.]